MSIAKIDTSISHLEVDTFYYDELIASIPEPEKASLLSELNNSIITSRLERLIHELYNLEMVGINEVDTRTLFLAALRGVKTNQISAAQLATLHVVDSAIRTLYTNPMVYFIHKYIDSDSELQRTYNLFFIANMKGLPASVKRFFFELTLLPKEGMVVNELPWRMRIPLIKRFFNLTDSEWQVFIKDMNNAPKSERFYYILHAPEEGCWSSITSNIQKVLKCMRVLDWMVDSKNGLYVEKIMVVPSFSMFQAALNAKAHTLKRNPIQLVPSYGYVTEEHCTELKKSGKMPFTLYLPERVQSMRYQAQVGGYRANIDGHPFETAFAGAIHDVYHAMREMSMSENVAKARMRLAEIAKAHPNNKKSPDSRAVDNFLIDGELIFSYPPNIDTMFDPEFRSEEAELFGKIFYSMGGNMHEDLKRSFIEDMVKNKSIWQDQFSLGRDDLLSEDLVIYDEIEKNHRKSLKNDDDNFSAVGAINTIGLLSNYDRTLDVPKTSSATSQFK